MCLPFIHFHHICVHRISGKHLPLTWKDKTKTSDEAGTISFFEGEVGVQGVGVQEGGGYGLCCTQGLGDLGIYIYMCILCLACTAATSAGGRREHQHVQCLGISQFYFSRLLNECF